jgi:hypothetical protein
VAPHASHSLSLDHRCRPEAFFTAMAIHSLNHDLDTHVVGVELNRDVEIVEIDFMATTFWPPMMA